MPRGTAAKVGDSYTSANGYHYTKTEDRGFVLTHWLTAEKARGGEQIDSDKEMVQFVPGYTKKDYVNPQAVRIIKKNTSSLRKRLAVVEDRIREYEAERERILKQLSR